MEKHALEKTHTGANGETHNQEKLGVSPKLSSNPKALGTKNELGMGSRSDLFSPSHSKPDCGDISYGSASGHNSDH